MCGRYASSRKPEDLAEEFEIDRARAAESVREPLVADYNVAPTKSVYAVLTRPDGPRDLRVVTWGLVPFWAKDPKIGSRMINARMETVAEKPAYRQAFAKRRCLLPADGYYEWYPTSQRTKAGKPLKQPFFIRPKDGSSLAMAGLYEIWRDKDKADDDPTRFLWTCTVITTDAEDEVGVIHDRMPMLVERDRWADWLDPERTATGDLTSLLVPAAPGRLEAFPVSTSVNSVRNNGPELVEPLPLDDVPDDLPDVPTADDTP
jgi:putative SOS response-associated peptidase YedK